MEKMPDNCKEKMMKLEKSKEVVSLYKEAEEYLKSEDNSFYNIASDIRNFRIQLIAITGGTISIFAALQNNAEKVAPLTITGFSLLGISLIVGSAHVLLGDSGRFFMAYGKKINEILGFIKRTELIEKTFKVDLENFKKVMLKYGTDIQKIKDSHFKQNSLMFWSLKITRIDNQIYGNIQVAAFIIGITLIILGLFIK